MRPSQASESGLQLHDVMCRSIPSVTTATQNGVYRELLDHYGHFLPKVMILLSIPQTASIVHLQIRMFD